MGMTRKGAGKSILAKTVALSMVVGTMVPMSVSAASYDISGHWAEKTISDWQAKGMIGGYEDGSFQPDKAITRAEFVRLINQALGFKDAGNVNFSDVSSSDWYYNDVAIAMGKQYCSGFPDGTFQPNAVVTRAQAASFVANAKGLTLNAQAADSLADSGSIADWAKGAIGAVIGSGYMSGYPDGSFQGDRVFTRAEAVSTLDRVINGVSSTPGQNDPVKDDTSSEVTDTSQAKAPDGYSGHSTGRKGSSGGGGGSSSGSGGSSSSTKENEITSSNAATFAGRTIRDDATIYIGSGDIVLDNVTFNGDVKVIDENGTSRAAITDLFKTKIIFKGNTQMKKDLVVHTSVLIITESTTTSTAVKQIRNIITKAITGIAGNMNIETVDVQKELTIAGEATVETITSTAPLNITENAEIGKVTAKAPVTTEAGTKVDTITAVAGTDASVDVKGEIATIETSGQGTVSAINIGGSAEPEVKITSGATVENVAVSETAKPKVTVESGSTVSNMEASGSSQPTVTLDEGAKMDKVVSTSTGATEIKGTGEVGSITATNPDTIKVDDTVKGNTEVQTAKLTSISVKSQPTKMSYKANEELSLAGLEVTLTYDDGTTKDVLLANFAAEGLTATPADGTKLTATHNGTAVTISHKDGVSVKTNALIVEGGNVTPAQKDITFSPAADLQVGTPSVNVGAVVGTLSASGGQAPYTFTLSGTAADNGKFEIAGNELKVKDNALSATSYTINVTATDATAEDDTVPAEEKYSVSKTITISVLPKASALAAPEVVKLEAGKGSWMAVTNAVSYTAQLYKGDSSATTAVGAPVTDITAAEGVIPTYDFTSMIAKEGSGTYWIKVKAIGDGKLYNDSAETTSATGYKYTAPEDAVKLATPAGLAWDTTVPGKATWTAVEKATEYEVTLTKASATVDTKTVTTNSVDFTDVIKEPGSYTFTVKAIGDGTTTTNSPVSATSTAYDYVATISASEISGLVAPAANEKPVKQPALKVPAAYDGQYAITSIKWKNADGDILGDDAAFASGGTYSAEIVLTATANSYKFAAHTPTVNVGTAQAGTIDATGATLTFTVQFESAGAAAFNFSGITQNGEAGKLTTTELVLWFDKEIPGNLTVNNITISGADGVAIPEGAKIEKVTTNPEGQEGVGYTVPVYGITSSTNLTVAVKKELAAFSPATQTVGVHFVPQVLEVRPEGPATIGTSDVTIANFDYAAAYAEAGASFSGTNGIYDLKMGTLKVPHPALIPATGVGPNAVFVGLSMNAPEGVDSASSVDRSYDGGDPITISLSAADGPTKFGELAMGYFGIAKPVENSNQWTGLGASSTYMTLEWKNSEGTVLKRTAALLKRNDASSQKAEVTAAATNATFNWTKSTKLPENNDAPKITVSLGDGEFATTGKNAKDSIAMTDITFKTSDGKTVAFSGGTSGGAATGDTIEIAGVTPTLAVAEDRKSLTITFAGTPTTAQEAVTITGIEIAAGKAVPTSKPVTASTTISVSVTEAAGRQVLKMDRSTQKPVQPDEDVSNPTGPSQPEGNDSNTTEPSQPEGNDSNTTEPSQPEGNDSNTTESSQPEGDDSNTTEPSQSDEGNSGTTDTDTL